ncbi:hypothetical protein [Sorangium sp. So ce362]|uniref:hypothetical protein n=1 Tax=Sorangium sp. So ce362 TaxID=3133303 RepID=UPI003F606258
MIAPESDWPQRLSIAVAESAGEFLEARGLDRNPGTGLAAAMALVNVALQVALGSGVPKRRLFFSTLELLARRTDTSLVTVPLPDASGAGCGKPS